MFRSFNKGFTLPELLVSITIMLLILTVIVRSQSGYTDTLALTNSVDEIGLALSQAQAYGIAVRELTPGSSDFSASYGLAFSLLGPNTNDAYISFADRNGNKIYDGDWSCPTGPGAECQVKNLISRNNRISSLCSVSSSGGDNCSVARVDVNFTRPNTQSRIAFFNNGGVQFNPGNSIGARITLRSPAGVTRSVIIYQNGQISVP